MSATTAAASAVPGRATSVGAISGVVPNARPISPKLLVLNVFVTVYGPDGAYNIDSSFSRSAWLVGHVAVVAGLTAGSAVSRVLICAFVVASSVSSANSVTSPVTERDWPTVASTGFAVASAPR